ncbi:MAG: hypothetical protein AAF065_11905 [Verrucomicrobiota bacterium]
MQTKITVNSEATQQKLRETASLVDGPKRAELMQVLGKGLETDLRGHFIKKNRRPNKRGYPKRNFWRDISTATNLKSATSSQATVAISDPRINPHVFGATIVPRRSKFLALPMQPEAYGVMPRSNVFPDMFFLPRKKKGGGFLARKNSDGSNRLMYFLTKSVKIPKDPDALPKQSEIDKNALRRAQRFIDRATSIDIQNV